MILPTLEVIKDPPWSNHHRIINHGYTNLNDFLEAAFIEIAPKLAERVRLAGASFVTACFHGKVLVNNQISKPFIYPIEGKMVDGKMDNHLYQSYREFIVNEIGKGLDLFNAFMEDNAELIFIDKLIVNISDPESWHEYSEPEVYH